MAQNLGTLFYTLSVDSGDLIAALKDADTKVEDLNKKIDKFVTSMNNVGDKLNKNVTLPIIALGTAATVMAADAEVANKKFAKSFEGSIKAANDAVKMLSDNYGIAESSAISAMSFTGDLLKGFGATADEALKTSTEVSKLAAVLSASDGIPFAEASERVTKALTGETEGLKSLGFVIRQTDIDLKLAAKGQEDFEGSALTMAKAQAILEIAVDQASDAIENFANNSDTLSYQMNTVIGDTKDMAVQFGNILIPVIRDILKTIEPIVEGFGDLSDESKLLIVQIAAIAAGLGPATKGIAAITTAIKILNTSALAGPLGIIALIGAATAALVIFSNEQAKAAKERHKDLFEFDPSTSIEDNIKKFRALGETIKTYSDRIAELNAMSRKSAASKAELAKLSSDLKAMLADREAMRVSIQAYFDEQERIKKATAEEKVALENAAKEAATKLEIEKKYKEVREQVVRVLQDEKTERQKILEEISKLESVKWADGSHERDRVAAIEALKAKIVELDKVDKEAAAEALALIEKNRKEAFDANQEKIEGSFEVARVTADEYVQATSYSREYYGKLKALLEQRLKDIEKERDEAIAAATKEGKDTSAIVAKYSAEEERIRKDLASNEEKRISGIQKVSEGYYQVVKANAEKELALIRKKKDEDIKAAEERGEDTTSLREHYAKLEEKIIKKLQDIETDKIELISELEEEHLEVYIEASDDRIAQLEYERDQAIAAAEEQGLETYSIEAFYLEKENALKDRIHEEELSRIRSEKDAEEDAKKAEAAANKKKTDEMINDMSRYAGYVTTALDSLSQLWANLDKQRINEIETELELALQAYDLEIAANNTLTETDVENNQTQKESELQRLADELAANILAAGDDAAEKQRIQEEYEAAVNALKEEYADKESAIRDRGEAEDKKLQNTKLKAEYNAEYEKYKIEKDAFKRNQAIAYAEIAIQTALAIVKGYAQLGPIGGSIAAVALAALGVLQAAVVYKQPAPVAPIEPIYLASGGYVPRTIGGIPAILGEGMNDEIVLPLTDKVYEKLGRSIIEQLEGTSSSAKNKDTEALNQIIQVLMDGTVLYEVVNTGLVNRRIRVPSAAII